jgi:hypothetical protein
MNCKALCLVLLASALFLLTAQTPAKPSVFTATQALAGRSAYENSCARCHTYSMLGRKGEEGELPLLASLAPPYLQFIGPRQRVPALMGQGFLKGYGQKTVAELFTLFRGAADTTPVSELNMDDETLINITSYILQRNGARPGTQPLTAGSPAIFQSLVE